PVTRRASNLISGPWCGRAPRPPAAPPSSAFDPGAYQQGTPPCPAALVPVPGPGPNSENSCLPWDGLEIRPTEDKKALSRLWSRRPLARELHHESEELLCVRFKRDNGERKTGDL